MSASFSQSMATASSKAGPGQRLAHLAPFVVGPVLLLVALLGAGWLYVPANPAAKSPATTLGFHDLHQLAGSGAIPTTWLQQSYFGWLGWAVVVVVVVLALATALTGRRSAAAALAGAGLVGLVVNVLAVKGALTWGQFGDQASNIRLGGYCAIMGYLLTLALGAARSARRPPRA